MIRQQRRRKPLARPNPKPRLPGDAALKDTVARMIRVDHAGEFGAQRIYAGQLAMLKNGPAADAVRHMARQEDRHLSAFERLIVERQVRPTVLHPLWNVAGYLLGAATAALGEQAAMACTAAVEETIVAHYRDQLERLGTDEPALRRLIAEFCAEEDEHRATGLQHGAEDLSYYPALRTLIRAGSQAAIWLSERI